ncbi:cupin domain-containing protein [Ramlibacter sp. XY19]|uniref:cupin domain-containing protein n=1 Tax=Ramlibacter paludis TaxID=2908000 RepID=UPI0023DB01B4|nr:cupin domain-containing protein [Ramlibacter paludis]MCG2595640.1 cupin domain-containing protein [Ramlibacter paludis]
MDTLPSYAEFESESRELGYSEVLERKWQPGQVLDLHSHPFDAHALVVAGEMWLTVNGRTQHLLPGGRFEVARGTPHAERYGDAGAIYWVARR